MEGDHSRAERQTFVDIAQKAHRTDALRQEATAEKQSKTSAHRAKWHDQVYHGRVKVG
jgi:hypothetical protein